MMQYFPPPSEGSAGTQQNAYNAQQMYMS
jgi:hypothetical protein